MGEQAPPEIDKAIDCLKLVALCFSRARPRDTVSYLSRTVTEEVDSCLETIPFQHLRPPAHGIAKPRTFSKTRAPTSSLPP